MTYKGVFISAHGVRELEPLFEDEEFSREVALKSPNGPQHNGGIYVTQPMGAPRKKKKSCFEAGKRWYLWHSSIQPGMNQILYFYSYSQRGGL